ncbi:LamB/YcsF family protein [Lactobacillus sp. 3B(2020)]|uniref:LamB/YcsF family protein n=1 Tax=Lactobacillus sp. 3B(2020) TaxID=2695882 RepID=UPI0015DD84CC|nr:5-oxoprolinase subunit PxpA [Lactobacillus sp. 3B(2020)]QLL69918.1 5-oxoprolinase subunit PxpA [Lactobacillus sp. 3B(2020)]
MVRIDLNSDLGESYGRYQLGNDQELMGLITSANVACGFHAGDPDVIAETVTIANQRGVAIGAHPGYPDRQGFGRRYMAMKSSEVEHLITYQIAALAGFTKGHRLHHVKPHGALYNAAAKDPKLALAICRGIQKFDPGLPLYGLAGSELIKAANQIGLPVRSEVFADRAYQADGSLVPRSQPGAVLTDPKVVAKRAVGMVENQAVTAITGEIVNLKADTICVHGDNAAALALIKQLRLALAENGVEITAG